MKTTSLVQSPQSRRARERADEALAGKSFRTSQNVAPTQWWCFGDPQAGFDTFCAVLEHHGLLDDDGLLRSDVGLVSMGDHFDYGAGKHDPVGEAERGLEGQRILAFLAAHPRSQVRILLGNHDAARVIEFAHLDDERFGVMKAASHAVPKNAADELRFALEHDVPCVTMPRRDFCGDACRVVVGVAASQANSTRLLLLDPGLAHAAAGAVDLLPLESVL